MATLIIDNYDSFTYNLVHAVASITGEMPVVIRNDEKTWERVQDLAFNRIIVSPGPGHPDNPRDFGVCGEVIRHAQVPVLGVCLGHQGIAAAFGGTVERAQPMHGLVREAIHDGDAFFQGIPERFDAVRYHSLVVSEPLPDGLKKIAWAEDGTVMALRHTSRPLWGVQFHPESILTEHGTTLLRNFLGAGTGIRKRPLTEAPAVLFRRHFAGQPGAFWLDDWSGYSYMGAGTPEHHTTESLDEALRKIHVESQPLPCPFKGGYIGYFTYEGEAVFVKARNFLVIDHRENAVYEVGVIGQAPPLPQAGANGCRNIRFRIPRAEYLDHVRQCLEWIAAGESYELCLTNQLLLESPVSPLDYYEHSVNATLRPTRPSSTSKARRSPARPRSVSCGSMKTGAWNPARSKAPCRVITTPPNSPAMSASARKI